MAVRSRHGRGRLLLAAMLTGTVLSGCNDTRDLAPTSASTPWRTDVVQREKVPVQRQPPAADPGPGATGEPGDRPARVFATPREDTRPAARPAAVGPDASVIDPNHLYALAELIDLAQTRNQSTRVAWERARQAAIAVGIDRATLLPELTVDALGGINHTASPFPTTLKPRGYITSDGQAIFPELVLKYLLLDFGGRAAAIEMSKQLSFSANVAFTAAHQKLIMDVSRAYFLLAALDAQLAAARTTLANARLVEAAAASKLGRGEGTVTDVALARTQVARAALGIPQAESGQNTARVDLLALLDLPPQTPIKVQNSADRPLSRTTGRTLDVMMEDALHQRPDLLARLGQLRASEQGIALARSELFPRLSVAANLQGNIGQLKTDDGPYESVKQPQYGLYLRFDWTLYQGGARWNRLHQAQSRRSEAEDSLREASTNALREIAIAYDTLQTGLAQYDAALAFRTAAQTGFDAATSAYGHGVGTLTDATNAQTNLASAQAAVVQAHAQALVNAAALAFATGDLTSAVAPSLTAALP